MNHKRRRAKRARSGCRMCKPWKQNGNDRRTLAERRVAQRDR